MCTPKRKYQTQQFLCVKYVLRSYMNEIWPNFLLFPKHSELCGDMHQYGFPHPFRYSDQSSCSKGKQSHNRKTAGEMFSNRHAFISCILVCSIALGKGLTCVLQSKFKKTRTHITHCHAGWPFQLDPRLAGSCLLLQHWRAQIRVGFRGQAPAKIFLGMS